jgi:hypothetical protein
MLVGRQLLWAGGSGGMSLSMMSPRPSALHQQREHGGTDSKVRYDPEPFKVQFMLMAVRPMMTLCNDPVLSLGKGQRRTSVSPSPVLYIS